MKLRDKTRILITGFLFLFVINSLFGQDLSKSEMENMARKAFNSGDYKTSSDVYEKLFVSYPRNLEYNYYLGRSYLHYNINLERAAENLRLAATNSFNTDAHFYLALTYLRLYDISGAEISMNNFINLSKKSAQNKLNVDYWKIAIASLKSESDAVQPIKLSGVEEFPLSQLSNAYALHVRGRLIEKPEQFMSEKDLKEDFQSLMFLPFKVENGEYIYVCSYSNEGSTNKDIYQIKRLSEMDYRFPTPMGNEINTEFDEEYPYYDPSSTTLYFSSKRPGGLGGYDLYHSKYNADLRSFTTPEALPFPYNTPYDDILYVPDSSGTYVIFSSNRISQGSNYNSFRIKLDQTAEFVFPKTKKELNDLAHFSKGFESELVAVNQLLPVVTEKEPGADYDKVLEQAMNTQLLCDSLAGELILVKNCLRAENDIEKRKEYFSEIALLESQLNNSQLKANDLFALAESLHPNSVTNSRNDATGLLQPDPVSEVGITNYTYNMVKEPASTKQVTKTSEIQQVNEKEAHDFQILNKSPYSTVNPIPKSQTLPNGLVYRIQLGVFSRSIPMDLFKGLSPISAEDIDGKELTKYFVGYFNSSLQAKSALDQVRNYGFQDAFIVPYYNCKKIAISEARDLEYAEK